MTVIQIGASGWQRVAPNDEYPIVKEQLFDYDDDWDIISML